MNQQARPARRGLGRGLGALIPTAPAPSAVEESEESGESGESGTAADGERGAGAAGSDVRVSPGAAGAAGGPGAPAAGGRSGQTLSGADGLRPRDDDRDRGDADGSGEPVEAVEALAPAEMAVAGAYFREIPLEHVRPNRWQPRQVFEEEALAELVHSIREVGLLQPVVVREDGPDSYELIMGERRWRAAQEAGLEAIPAIVRQTDDSDMLRDALLENLHRAELNPLEEAAAYGQLLEDFGCTHDELAQRIGRSRPQISNTLRLLKLGPAVQRRVAAGVLSAGHARALLAVTDPDRQDRLAHRVVAEGISVRALEEIVALGEDESAPKPARRKKPVAPGLTDLADRLADRFETRVKVDLGKAKGKITVEFASLDDLQRIVDIMDPRNRDDRPV